MGIGVLGPRTLAIGANRDESPDRPTAGPGILIEEPRVVGGRDLRSGGTWLAVREARFVCALLNRAPIPTDSRPASLLRSRGHLCLETAAQRSSMDAPGAIDPGTGEPRSPRAEAALRLLAQEEYGHCTLVGAAVDGDAWAIHAGHGGAPELGAIDPGWHVVTHASPDDRREPRTRWLVERLSRERPGDAAEAIALLGGILRRHAKDDHPAVCLHRDPFPTVSSSVLVLGAVDRPTYLHAAGPPCSTGYEDFSDLLG